MIRKTIKLYQVILIVLLSTILFGCKAKPTETDCKIALANFLRLQLGSQMSHTQINKTIESDPVSKKMVQMCIKNKPKKQVDCEMSAPSLKDLKQCNNVAN